MKSLIKTLLILALLTPLDAQASRRAKSIKILSQDEIQTLRALVSRVMDNKSIPPNVSEDFKNNRFTLTLSANEDNRYKGQNNTISNVQKMAVEGKRIHAKRPRGGRYERRLVRKVVLSREETITGTVSSKEYPQITVRKTHTFTFTRQGRFIRGTTRDEIVTDRFTNVDFKRHTIRHHWRGIIGDSVRIILSRLRLVYLK